MSLQLAAQHLASRGRGPDTQLIHMAPQEVAGLHALAKAHGGSLTTNPDTGLPEAGFLSSILPMVLGAALAPLTAGTSLAFLGATPFASALTVGALSGLATGSLKKGLMAGLGAYGGAGLGASLAGAGTGAISAGTAGSTAGIGSAALDAGTVGAEALGAGAETLGSVAGTGAQVGAPIVDAANLSQTGPNFFGGATGQITPTVSPINAAEMVQTATPAAPIATPAAPMADPTVISEATQERLLADKLAQTTPYETAKAGFGQLMEKPSQFMTKDNLKYAGMAAAPMLFQAPKLFGKPDTGSTLDYTYDYNPENRTSPFIKVPKIKTAADGGLMGVGPIEAMSQQNQPQMRPAYAQGGASDMAVNPYTGAENFAKGGQSHLGDYSDGGRMLRGPGDGVSDSIPATIGNKRPARLADGEFVVPARIVSEIGNGSSEAGARKLYAMMDRVQKARAKTTGKGRVATNTKAERLLPV